jgi:hypothetical protein
MEKPVFALIGDKINHLNYFLRITCRGQKICCSQFLPRPLLFNCRYQSIFNR